MNKIRAIVKRPDEEYGHGEEIDNTLEELQRIVGGYIETVSVFDDVLLIVNEEGKFLGLEPNINFYGDVLVGTIIAVGRDEEEFCDLPLTFNEWKRFVRW